MIDVEVLDVRPHPCQATNNPGCWAVQFRVSHKGTSRTFWRWHTGRRFGPDGALVETNEQPSRDEILARFWNDTFAELHGFSFTPDELSPRGVNDGADLRFDTAKETLPAAKPLKIPKLSNEDRARAVVATSKYEAFASTVDWLKSLKYRRGEADGRMGHPPAEVTETYLQGYADGLGKRR